MRKHTDAIPQGSPWQVLQCEEGRAVGFVYIIDGSDVGMAERRQRVAFPEESLPRLLRVEKVGLEELKRDYRPVIRWVRGHRPGVRLRYANDNFKGRVAQKV